MLQALLAYGGREYRACFNGHPPLWVNATLRIRANEERMLTMFQWAPTLVGECYSRERSLLYWQLCQFQWAPTLVGECYRLAWFLTKNGIVSCFNGHPPLGVNATGYGKQVSAHSSRFQWAPTLVGECYIC